MTEDEKEWSQTFSRHAALVAETLQELRNSICLHVSIAEWRGDEALAQLARELVPAYEMVDEVRNSILLASVKRLPHNASNE